MLFGATIIHILRKIKLMKIQQPDTPVIITALERNGLTPRLVRKAARLNSSHPHCRVLSSSYDAGLGLQSLAMFLMLAGYGERCTVSSCRSTSLCT